MELVKNIFFNTDKIVGGEKVKISYVGYLFQNGSEEVFLHYGFDFDWNNSGETKMEKTELGFQAEIEIPEGANTLHLCYKNENNEWDNNFGQNFSFAVETAESAVPVIADEPETIEVDDTTTTDEVYDNETTAEETGVEEETETSLTTTAETGMAMHKGLRKTYIWSKKIKLAILKIIKYVPKIISGNYKRKINEE